MKKLNLSLFVKLFPSLCLIAFFCLSLNVYFSGMIFKGYASYDAKRFLQLLLLGALALSLFLFPSQRKAWLQQFFQLPTLVRWGLACVIILGFFSSLLAPRTDMALLEISLYILLFYATILIAAQQQLFKQSYNILLTGIVFLGIIFYLYVFIYNYIHLPPHRAHYRLFIGFMNQRFFAQYQVWTLLLLSAPVFLIRKARPLILILVLILASAWWGIAVLNGSKGLFLSVLIASIITACIFRKIGFRWLMLQGIFVLIGPVFYCLFAYLLQLHVGAHGITNLGIQRLLSTTQSSLDARFALWHYALHLIKQHPILGAGPMQFAYYVKNMGIAYMAAHPHNSLLLFASEWGLLATAIMLVILSRGILACCKRDWQSGTQTSPYFSACLLASLLAGVIYSLISGVFVMPMGQVMLALFLGWMLGNFNQGYFQNIHTSWYSELTTLIIPAIAVFIVLYTIFPMVLYLPQLEIHWLLAQKQKFHFNQVTIYPRFWLQGLI